MSELDVGLPPPALRLRVAILAAAVGCSITAVEFAAVRQAAPAFGQAIHVWAAAIGVLLLALAAGNALGGRWAARLGATPPARPGPLQRWPYVAPLALAALWEALVAAWWGPSVLRWLAPSELPAPGGLPAGLVGSVLGMALLHGPPLLLLATASPRLVGELEVRWGSARAAGTVLAAGTLGGLVGCFAAPLWLLQTVGTRATLWIAAALPVLVALGMVLGGRAPARSVPEPTQPGRAAGGALLLVAALTGAAVMAVEFLAVRLFGPWFGQSNRIWANTIGVILLALALGAWVGGRWGARGDRRGGTVFPLLLAALWLAGTALESAGLPELLLPRGVDSMRLLPVAFAGSLAATALTFGIPMLLLGTVPPLLVRRLAPRWGAGRAAGRVAAAGTLGSLVGTFAGPLLLVPGLGSRRGLVFVAAVLLIAAGLAAAGRRARLARSGGLAAGVIALVVVLLLPRGVVREHPGQVLEVESAYQTVRVVREKVGALVPSGSPADGGDLVDVDAVFLRHDEDAETYQSIWLPERGTERLSGGRYYEQMALGARLARPAPGRPLRVLIVGYAGGAVHRTLRDSLPPGLTLEVLGVEIDPSVVAVARDHLDLASLEGPGLELVTGEDGRTVVNALPAERRFDLVLIDAYARTNYIPFQVATREFFQRLRRHLAPEGWIGVNVLGSGLQGPVCRSVAATLDAAVGPTFLHPNLWFPGNVILWASPGADARPRLLLRGGEDRLHPLLEIAAYALERLAVRHVTATDGGVILTDDLSPSDRLADEELGL